MGHPTLRQLAGNLLSLCQLFVEPEAEVHDALVRSTPERVQEVIHDLADLPVSKRLVSFTKQTQEHLDTVRSPEAFRVDQLQLAEGVVFEGGKQANSLSRGLRTGVGLPQPHLTNVGLEVAILSVPGGHILLAAVARSLVVAIVW
jgi:hypothetical protein